MYIKAIKTNPIIVPEKKHSFVEIPGKAGSVLIRDQAAKDVEEVVECWYERPETVSAREFGRMLDVWLTSFTWERLIFDDDSDFYRQSVVTSSISLNDIRNVSGNFSITFRCRPNYIEV